MLPRHARNGSFAALLALAAAACASGSHLPAALPPPAAVPAVRIAAVSPGSDASASRRPSQSKIKLSLATLGLLGTGPSAAKRVAIDERNYRGTFRESSTCEKVAEAQPRSGTGPSFRVTVTPLAAGACTIAFEDAKQNRAVLDVRVTTASIALSSDSISPGSASAVVTLLSVDGKRPNAKLVRTVTAAVPSCASQCRISAPQAPPGSDTFAVTIFDGTNGRGNRLATGRVTATVVGATANRIAASLAKVPAYLAFGTMPGATAGTPLSTPLPLTVEDADRYPIAGTYAKAVRVSDADTSPLALGSSLSVDGGASSRTVELRSSNDRLTLAYGGFAMQPATLSASAKNVASATAAFTPSIPAVAYQGPEKNKAPEIDLYDPNPGQPGNAETFGLSQAGWSGAPFDRSFVYTLGSSSDCSSFHVNPPSGSGTTFTVTVGSSSVAGACTLVATGATSGSTLSVKLTYTTSGIGVSARRRR